jgi:hypothetical protein
MRSAATWQRGIGHEQYESMTPLRHLSGEDTAQRWHPIRHSGYPFARDRALDSASPVNPLQVARAMPHRSQTRTSPAVWPTKLEVRVLVGE